VITCQYNIVTIILTSNIYPNMISVVVWFSATGHAAYAVVFSPADTAFALRQSVSYDRLTPASVGHSPRET
ncbi:MAG: hypothetical protein WAN65_32935, partial [Candidatus Sulfotelmatobacter sp.]